VLNWLWKAHSWYDDLDKEQPTLRFFVRFGAAVALILMLVSEIPWLIGIAAMFMAFLLFPRIYWVNKKGKKWNASNP
jgi:hypothetical protein